jgi:hypothetical protein
MLTALLAGCGPLEQRLLDGTAVAAGYDLDSAPANGEDGTGGGDDDSDELDELDLLATQIQQQLDEAAAQATATEIILPTDTVVPTPVVPTNTPAATFTPTLSPNDVVKTSLAKTLAILETGTPTTEPTVTVAVPTASPGGPTATPGPTQVPCLAMRFIADVTYPPYSIVQPNTTFYKTWYVQNVGSCTWNGNYAIVHYDGFQLGGTTPLRLGSGVSVPPGKYVNITIQLWTGPQSGEFASLWMMTDENGTQFGGGPARNEPLVVRITVPGISPPEFTQPASTAPPFYTPTP